MASVLFDKDGNPWGPFETSADIMAFVNKKWPGEKQDENNLPSGGKGWNVYALRPPES